jgi:hypothetical protein
MSESDKRQHREAIYSGRSPLEVSWYRKESALPLIDRCGLEQDAAIIEVDGLTSCSGLDIVQYNAEKLPAEQHRPMRGNLRYLAIFLSPVLLLGCTNREVYEALQNRQKVLCQEQPKSEYGKCMQEADESYDSYKKNREDAESGK